MADPFTCGQWIWTPDARKNHYVVFARTVEVPPGTASIRIRITASYHYELWINGRFIHRGPVHGDPQWCHYDEIPLDLRTEKRIHIAILVHHSRDIELHYLTPAPPGLRADFEAGPLRVGTDDQWKCLTLAMWRNDVPQRNHSQDYCEDYDASREPDGWSIRQFTPELTATWPQAVPVPDAGSTWGGYQPREIPLIRRTFIEPKTLRAWQTAPGRAESIQDVSCYGDTETLTPVNTETSFSHEALNGLLAEANAFTFDLGREHVGFYFIDLEAPRGTVLELSGAELLREGRPWVHKWNTCFSARYTTRAGRQTFTSFGWNGFRYLHLVIRSPTARVRIHRIGCVARSVPLVFQRTAPTADSRLKDIFDLCRHTLEVGAQELLIDCPTREQAPAWADSLIAAMGIWKGFGQIGYMHWYLEAFLRAPFDENGQISGRYPTIGRVWLDFSLIPLLAQQFYKEGTGAYYRPSETLQKALQLKKWYDSHLDTDGLVAFDFTAYYSKGLRNFIDHPGLMHKFPHPGIDRDGVSCPLNIFFYGFVRILSLIAAEIRHPEEASLRNQADHLRKIIPERFFDNGVFHDCRKDGQLSAGTSWQTNGLAVYFNLVSGTTARHVMEAVQNGYDRLCRCSPYFHFYFLPALRKAGLEKEAVELIVKEWGPMLDRDATTTWECFGGDASDSLCHPWSTAPFLFLLPGAGCPSLP